MFSREILKENPQKKTQRRFLDLAANKYHIAQREPTAQD
jgi:hypothetical protein